MLPSLSFSQILARLQSPYYWGEVLGSETAAGYVSYSFAGDPAALASSLGPGETALTGVQQNAVTIAAAVWSGLGIVGLYRNAPSNSGSIGFVASSTAASAVTANDHIYSGQFETISGATVTLNSTSGIMTNPAVGGPGFLELLQAIGFALGLQEFSTSNGTPNAATDAAGYEDSHLYTVMSNFGPDTGNAPANGNGYVAWGDWTDHATGITYAPQTPMMNDYLALVYLYARAGTDPVKLTHGGDTTYGYGSTLGGAEASVYDFSFNKHPVLCLFDTRGVDTLNLSGDTHNDVIDLRPGAFSSVMGLTNNLSIYYNTYIENFVGGSGNDVIICQQNSDYFSAFGFPTHSINAGAGDDIVYASAASEAINGDAGVNTLSYYYSGAGVVVYLYANLVSGGDAEGDTIYNFQNVQGSNVGADLLLGTNGDNAVTGWGGDDIIFGYGGSDFIDGGEGNDLIEGGAKGDFLAGGLGNNTLSYYNSQAPVIVYLYANAVSGGDAQGDTISGFQNIFGSNAGVDWLAGDNGNNAIAGWGGGDYIFGYGGYDYIIAGDGDDYVEGGSASDFMDGGTGNNTLAYYNSTVGVAINLAAGTASGGDAVGDVFANFQNLWGSNLAGDSLTGDSGDNAIAGWGGDDVIEGKGGNDYLVGGAGKDTFTFSAAGFGHDEIVDFTAGQDHIKISTVLASNYAALTFTQNGGSTIITIGADTIQFDGVLPGQLQASDFIFV